MLIACLLPLFALHGGAADTQLQSLYDDSDAARIFSQLDEETLSLMAALGVDIADPESILRVSPAGVIDTMLSVFRDGLSAPMKHCALLLGAVMLFAVADAASPALGAKNKPGGMIFMLFIAFSVITPVSRCITGVLSALETVSMLTKLLIPVMGGLMAASGAPMASAALSAASLGAAELVSSLVDRLFVPVTGAYAAVCIVAAVNPVFNLQNAALFFRRLFTVVLGGVSAIFTGVLALRGTAAKAGDSLLFKGAKFLIGGLVPVVGSAMSEGLSTVTAALDAVNDTVGVLGIAAIALIILPTVIRVLTEWAVLAVCSFAATFVDQPQVAFYLSGVSNVIVMLNILLLFDGFVFISALGMLVGFGG